MSSCADQHRTKTFLRGVSGVSGIPIPAKPIHRPCLGLDRVSAPLGSVPPCGFLFRMGRPFEAPSHREASSPGFGSKTSTKIGLVKLGIGFATADSMGEKTPIDRARLNQPLPSDFAQRFKLRRRRLAFRPWHRTQLSSYSSPQIYRATKLLNLVICPSSARSRITMHDAFGHDAGDSQSQGEVGRMVHARALTTFPPFQREAGGWE